MMRMQIVDNRKGIRNLVLLKTLQPRQVFEHMNREYLVISSFVGESLQNRMRVLRLSDCVPLLMDSDTCVKTLTAELHILE